MKKVTQERLKELYSFNPETGYFTRLKRTANNQVLGEIVKPPRRDGYTQLSVDGTLCLQHLLVFLYMTGAFPNEAIAARKYAETRFGFHPNHGTA